MKTVDLFTDGSCWPNPGGPGGTGVVLKYGNHVRELSTHSPSTTNNRQEVEALILGLGALKRPCQVRWTTDSQYAIGCLRWALKEKPMKLSKPNQDLILALRQVLRDGGHMVDPMWIRGHTGHPENERCDKLAEESRKKIIHLKAA